MIFEVNKLDKGLVQVVFVPCPQCGKQHSLVVRRDELEDYYATGYVVQSFPNLLPAQHELFMTGIGGDCFKEIFKGGEY